MYIKIKKDKIKVIELAKIIGKSEIVIPYINHEKTPVVNIINIYKEISLVLLVFQTFIACGRKANVVQKAAKKPIYFKIKFVTIKLRKGRSVARCP